ncbi:uncharacterized protein LOC125471996 isoform X2 [Pyrus x bretschneideri]|uniref:uncharacterized protein LOC125471996 isoform X2 n=1 Tax=Pyrus x bretschneideri TaxID=225117 RepID=UPI00202F74CB|nr:uncharacterized protein LOC125471996 isoform X2 [Pyrus x bretschneideri]
MPVFLMIDPFLIITNYTGKISTNCTRAFQRKRNYKDLNEIWLKLGGPGRNLSEDRLHQALTKRKTLYEYERSFFLDLELDLVSSLTHNRKENTPASAYGLVPLSINHHHQDMCLLKHIWRDVERLFLASTAYNGFSVPCLK